MALQVATDLGDGAAARDEDGGGGGPCVLVLDHDMYMKMYEIVV